MKLPTLEDLYDFLDKNYKPDRFASRDGWFEGVKYSKQLTQAYLEDLEKKGESLISRNESVTGKAIRFNANLEIIEGEE